MKALLIFFFTVSAMAQFPRQGALASTPVTPPGTQSVYFTQTGNHTLCLSSTPTCGSNLPNTDIFYSLDGSPATSASRWYSCPNSATGCINYSVTASTAVTINAVLIQTSSTTATGCSTGSPCHGVIVQNGQNVKSLLKSAVTCPATGTNSCPNTLFPTLPTPINHGGCTTNNEGTRGVPNGGGYTTGLSQPSVDLYIANSNTAAEFWETGNGNTNCEGGSIGDTEILVPYDSSSNQSPASPNGCDQCTLYEIQRTVAHDYKPGFNPAQLSELETDHTNWDAASGSSTPTGAWDLRCTDYEITTNVGTVKYGGYQHSSQSSGWKAFPTPGPNHDCSMPFGTISATPSTGCTLTFTPGATAYNGHTAWGLDPISYLLVDQGTSNAETIFIASISGNTVTGCVRGVGGTPHAHSAGATASLTVNVQYSATMDTTSGATCTSGETSAYRAMYYNYLMLNGNFYGTPQAQALMPPNITVQQIWNTQTVNGKPHSAICDYWSNATTYGLNRVFQQWQIYSKAGSGVNTKVGILNMNDNLTASFGQIGTYSQWTGTVMP